MADYINKNLINGHWITASDNQTFAVSNPATGAVLAQVPSIPPQQVQECIRAASVAFQTWRELPARNRSDILLAISRIIETKAEELAHVITSEQGKPLSEARGEVAYASRYFRWFSEEAVRIDGDIIQSDSPSKRIFVIKQPIGVVAAITPWNFPLAMLARKMGAALAAGCTFIAKPAPETPLTAFALGQICIDAGVPVGVVNIITGDAEMIGEQMMHSPLVNKVTFTGSTEVGKILIRRSADTVKKLTLELGGNAPVIIFDDADLSKAIESLIYGKYRNAGQTCICINRFLVHEKIAPLFTELLIVRSKKLVVGDGSHTDTDIGPLISDEAVAKVSGLLQSAQHEGAKLVLSDSKQSSQSRFMSPAILTNVTPTMRVWKEEIFGPICTITPFTSEEEALSLANGTPYGLAAYVYTSDLARGLRIGEQLDFGMVGINDTAISAVQAPFGGIKESGYGREGSKYGIHEYLTLKYLSVQM